MKKGRIKKEDGVYRAKKEIDIEAENSSSRKSLLAKFSGWFTGPTDSQDQQPISSSKTVAMETKPLADSKN